MKIIDIREMFLLNYSNEVFKFITNSNKKARQDVFVFWKVNTISKTDLKYYETY